MVLRLAEPFEIKGSLDHSAVVKASNQDLSHWHNFHNIHRQT